MWGYRAALQSDQELIAAVLVGRRSAFADLVRRYERTVRAVTVGVLRDHHAAEDAAQETFVAAYRRLGTLRDTSAFGSWLTTIARRRAIDMARRTHRQVPLDAAGEVPAAAGDGRLDEQSERLLAEVMRLPEGQRVATMLRHFDGHSVQEIADIMGRPVGTITKLLSRAHQRLRRRLREKESLR